MQLSAETAVVNAVIVLHLCVTIIGATERNAEALPVKPLGTIPNGTDEAVCTCGPHGECELDKDGKKECACKVGFEENNGFCEECDCGPLGSCSFNRTVKTCHCFFLHAEKDGKCIECSCSLVIYNENTGVRMGCLFENGVEKCLCTDGYREENTKCVDINECLDSSACPNDTECLNIPGSYICKCKLGYTAINNDAKRYGCRDIDECEEENGCPFNETSTCVNTPGSFHCVCKAGFSSKYNSESSIRIVGCDKDGLGTGYIVLITVVTAVVVTAVAVFIKKRCFS